MSRTQQVTILLATALCYVVPSVVQAAPSPLSPSEAIRPDGLSVIYDPGSGYVSARAPDGSQLTAIELRSNEGMFTGECDNLGGVFDVCNDGKVFKLATAGFSSVDLGPILPTLKTSSVLVSDLLVDGASVGGDFITGSGAYLIVVPEPAGATLLGLGFVLLASTRRRRSRA